MNWLDLVFVFLIIGLAGLEMFRGFGRAIFDALCLYAALWTSSALSLPLAHSVHFHSGAAINHSYAYALLFVGLGALSFGVSRFVYGMTLMHTGMFEGLLGLAAGVAVGIMLAHGIANAVAMADPSGRNGAQLVRGGLLGNEVLSFQTYHSIINTLTGAGTYRRELPNVAGK